MALPNGVSGWEKTNGSISQGIVAARLTRPGFIDAVKFFYFLGE